MLAEPANPSRQAAASSMGLWSQYFCSLLQHGYLAARLQSPFSLTANLRTAIASSSHGSTVSRSTGPASAGCLGWPAQVKRRRIADLRRTRMVAVNQAQHSTGKVSPATSLSSASRTGRSKPRYFSGSSTGPKT